MSRVRVLAVANADEPDLGYVGDHLLSLGAGIERAWRDNVAEELPEAGAHDLVVSLGSAWSVYWDEHAKAVEREAAYLRGCVEADVPVLAICFGGQMLSYALGGLVDSANRSEYGWHDVSPAHPALDHGPYFQWHSDAFTVPSGAYELARNDVGPQAFAVRCAVGLQFHPEVTPAMAAKWSREEPEVLQRLGLAEDAFVIECETRAEEARRRASALVDAVLDGAFVPAPF
jgi:GMP synthase-like glutamine amidotransferase